MEWLEHSESNMKPDQCLPNDLRDRILVELNDW